MKNKEASLDLLLSLLLRLVSPLKSLAVQESKSIVFVRPENIAYITVDKKKLVIVDTTGRKWIRFDTIADVEKLLKDDPRFFRSHKSCLVNLYHVKSIQKPTPATWSIAFYGSVDSTAELAEVNVKKLRDLIELIPPPPPPPQQHPHPSDPKSRRTLAKRKTRRARQ